MSEEVVDFLGRTEAYPDQPAKVERIETHISWVFLTDRFVYKLKKPVHYDFLDFSTVQARRWACEEEVRLNRRLAPSTYLAVMPIVADPRGRLRLGSAGRPVDWVVKMRRLPADVTLERLIRTRRVTDSQVQHLAAALARFYRQLPPATVRTCDYHRSVQDHVDANRRELLDPQHALPKVVVRRIHTAQLRLLKLAPEWLDSRVCDGRIVDGHGDLRPEHIYLNPAPTIIDCIEFSPDLRRLDVVDELCFLAMECDGLGAPSIGRQMIEAYCRTSDDRPPPPLVSFYKCYRACIRAKVFALRAQQCEGAERAGALTQAEDYLRLADRYRVELGPPAVLVVRGLMGSGKSTLAATLAESLGAELLQTDVIRHEMFGPSDGIAAYGENHYQQANRRRVYEEMLRRAEGMLRDGLSVVLDGTFLSARSRANVVSTTRRLGGAPLIINCRCPDRVALARIAERMAGGGSASEARPELYHYQQQEEEPSPYDTATCDVDTTTSPIGMVETVWARLRAEYPHLLGAATEEAAPA